MYDDDDLLPLSALQHLVFCERRAALVYVEGQWEDNVYTAEGRGLHEKAHEPGVEARPGVRAARGLMLRSLRLGLSGKTDVVEFHETAQDAGVKLDGVEGFWRPYPVEYKRGRRRRERSFEVQLCAQALCIEEMLGAHVPRGALYYGKTRRRLEVDFDSALRSETEAAARRLHKLVQSGRTPAAHRGPKCAKCSLAPVCLPDVSGGRSGARYVKAIFDEAERKPR